MLMSLMSSRLRRCDLRGRFRTFFRIESLLSGMRERSTYTGPERSESAPCLPGTQDLLIRDGKSAALGTLGARSTAQRCGAVGGRVTNCANTNMGAANE